MASLDDLIAAAGLTPPGERFDWQAAEEVLNAPIPGDYQALLDAGGAGAWFDYIRVFAPGARYGDRNLLDGTGTYEDLKFLWEDDAGAPPDDLGAGSWLLMWGGAGGGEHFYWRVEPGADPSSYPIYLEDAGGEPWERYDMTVTDFLAGIMRGEVESEALASGFMDVDQTFLGYEE